MINRKSSHRAAVSVSSQSVLRSLRPGSVLDRPSHSVEFCDLERINSRGSLTVPKTYQEVLLGTESNFCVKNSTSNDNFEKSCEFVFFGIGHIYEPEIFSSA